MEKEKYMDKDRYRKFAKMILAKDAKGLREFIVNNDNVLEEEIDDLGHTMISTMVGIDTEECNELLKEVMPRVSEHTIAKFGLSGGTAVHAAASFGNMEALRLFEAKNTRLLSMFSRDGCLPIHLAASGKHLNAVEYLLPLTNEAFLRNTSELLLLLLVQSNLHGQYSFHANLVVTISNILEKLYFLISPLIPPKLLNF